jgi:hypothetical protein
MPCQVGTLGVERRTGMKVQYVKNGPAIRQPTLAKTDSKS